MKSMTNVAREITAVRKKDMMEKMENLFGSYGI